MEAKFTGACPLWFSHLLARLGLYPVSFSKYGAFYRQEQGGLSPADLLAGRGGNVQVAFSEPQVYPTAMANAVYDLCCTMPEVSRVWLKLASFEMARTYVLVVEHEGSGKEVLGRISEAAAPLSRNMPVGMMEYRAELGQTALKDAVPLYDRELEL